MNPLISVFRHQSICDELQPVVLISLIYDLHVAPQSVWTAADRPAAACFCPAVCLLKVRRPQRDKQLQEFNFSAWVKRINEGLIQTACLPTCDCDLIKLCEARCFIEYFSISSRDFSKTELHLSREKLLCSSYRALECTMTSLLTLIYFVVRVDVDYRFEDVHLNAPWCSSERVKLECSRFCVEAHFDWFYNFKILTPQIRIQ